MSEIEDVIKPLRKVTDGVLKNKQRSMQKMLDAVGNILRTKGQYRITGDEVIRKCGCNRRLIYCHFGNVQKLVDSYYCASDIWMQFFGEKLQHYIDHPKKPSQAELKELVSFTLNAVIDSYKLQNVLYREISEHYKLFKDLIERREKLIVEFLKALDENLGKTKIDIGAFLSLQFAGINYLVLHSRTDNASFWNTDLNKIKDITKVRDTIYKLIDMAF